MGFSETAVEWFLRRDVTVAQLEERPVEARKCAGSSPAGDTGYWCSGNTPSFQVGAAGSIPAYPSKAT